MALEFQNQSFPARVKNTPWNSRFAVLNGLDSASSNNNIDMDNWNTYLFKWFCQIAFSEIDWNYLPFKAQRFAKFLQYFSIPSNQIDYNQWNAGFSLRSHISMTLSHWISHEVWYITQYDPILKHPKLPTFQVQFSIQSRNIL